MSDKQDPDIYIRFLSDLFNEPMSENDLQGKYPTLKPTVTDASQWDKPIFLNNGMYTLGFQGYFQLLQHNQLELAREQLEEAKRSTSLAIADSKSAKCLAVIAIFASAIIAGGASVLSVWLDHIWNCYK